MMRSRASAYLRCFSSRSLAARLWRSANVSAARRRSSSSLSSSSANDSPASPFVALLAFGAGFLLSTLTCGLNSSFRGMSPLVSKKYALSGCSAASHSFLLASACAAFRSFRFKTLETGALGVVWYCKHVFGTQYAAAHGCCLHPIVIPRARYSAHGSKLKVTPSARECTINKRRGVQYLPQCRFLNSPHRRHYPRDLNFTPLSLRHIIVVLEHNTLHGTSSQWSSPALQKRPPAAPTQPSLQISHRRAHKTILQSPQGVQTRAHLPFQTQTASAHCRLWRAITTWHSQRFARQYQALARPRMASRNARRISLAGIHGHYRRTHRGTDGGTSGLWRKPSGLGFRY